MRDKMWKNTHTHTHTHTHTQGNAQSSSEKHMVEITTALLYSGESTSDEFLHHCSFHDCLQLHGSGSNEKCCGMHSTNKGLSTFNSLGKKMNN